MFTKNKKSFIKKALNFLLILTMLVTVLPFSGTAKVKAEEEEDIRTWLASKKPLYAGYYRTWHDSSSMLKNENGEVSQGGGKVKMGDIPKEVDIVFMFDDGQADDSPFYTKTKDEYVPKLHANGQKIIRTLGLEHLNGKTGLSTDFDKYPNNEEGYKKLAEDIIKTYVSDLGLDGLDIDIEKHNYSESEQDLKNLKEIFGIEPEEQRARNARAEKVFKEIAKLIGPNGKDKSKLLIIDTTMPAESTILKQNYDNIDLFLVQRYGKTGELGNPHLPGTHSFLDLDGLWNSLKKYIPANKFMIGFSFYEERSPKGNRWYDIPFKDSTSFDAKHENKIGNGIKDSRAGRYALWQPKDGGLKGGIFSYAVERDGVYHPYKEDEDVTNNPEIDTWCETEFKQSKELKQIMLNAQGDEITEADFADEALRESIIAQVGRFKGDLERFDGELKLNNPAIKNTTGLNALKKVSKITFDGLTDLEVLDIKGCGLETFDITPCENYKKLTKIDISANKLDLSPESPDRKALDKLMENNQAAKVEFGEQEPKTYPDYALEKLPESLEKADEDFDLSTVLTITKTVRGINIEKLADLKIKDKDVIKEGHELAAWDYTGFTFKVIKHDQTSSTESKISRNEDARYKVMVFDSNSRKIAEKMVKVGEGKEFLDNLSYKAKIVWQSKPCPDNENKNSINYLFDDNLNNERPQIFTSDRLLKFIIDIGENAEVKQLEFYNDTTLSANSVDFEAIKDNNVDTGKFNFPYCLNKDNSTKVKTFDLKDGKVKYSEGIDTSESRYWIITFNGTFMGMFAQEIKLLGTIKQSGPIVPSDPQEPQDPQVPQEPSHPQSPVIPYTPSAGSTPDNKTENKEEPKKTEIKEIEAANDETPQGRNVEKRTSFTQNKLVYKVVNEAANLIRMLKATTTPKKFIVPASVKQDGNTFNISELGNRVFKGKKQLKTIVIGKNVTKIGMKCFAGCSNLTFIEFKGTKITSIGKDAFKGVSTKIRIKVPANMNKKERAKLKKMLIKAKINKNIVIE